MSETLVPLTDLFAQFSPTLANTFRSYLTRAPANAMARVDETLSVDGDFTLDQPLHWVKGSLKVTGNLLVQDHCVLLVDGDLECRNAVLPGCKAIVGGKVVCQGIVTAKSLEAKRVTATAIVFARNEQYWAKALRPKSLPLLELEVASTKWLVTPEVCSTPNTVDRWKLSDFIKSGGVVAVSPVNPDP